jgi:hypothetical protein
VQPVAEEEHPVDLLRSGGEDVDVDFRVGPLEEAMLAGTYAASSAESATSSTMSMSGFAGRPGTDVEPTCSIRITRSPRTERIRSSSRSYRRGQ